MNNLLIVIPAIKKNAVIPDQLIKKLNGITLIQRAINTALELTSSDNILIITDSIEISLISERNGIKYHKDASLTFNSENILDIISRIIQNTPHDDILLYQANTPLIDSTILYQAYTEFLNHPNLILISVKTSDQKLLQFKNNVIVDANLENYYEELQSFLIFTKSAIYNRIYKPYVIESEKSIEIANYQDWWVCEKVLQRKKIVFHVIANIEIGMGHIFHSLALAHEITDHEIVFVCDEKYKLAVEKIASMDYKVISTKDTLSTILDLKPDLIINDILNTDASYINTLKSNNIKIVNFEDLGEGSKYADLVFNELYDIPQCDGKHYYWGYEYLALRDEFYEATPHIFVEDVKEILISFGGTDQNNLTLLALQAVLQLCETNNIKINIVCGSGYAFKDELESYLKNIGYKDIELTYASGIISKIMEKTPLAIASNGRTVYELADMNIPSIVISHHEREASHTFATLDKGFINLGVINSKTQQMISERFEKLVSDQDYRKLLFMNIQKYNFRDNKQKVVKKILELL